MVTRLIVLFFYFRYLVIQFNSFDITFKNVKGILENNFVIKFYFDHV
jgi:hypothetical protein